MLQLNVKNETSRLREVVLGTVESNGETPHHSDTYDPKSKEHIMAGTYPLEKDMTTEMDAFKEVLEKYNVKVHRPKIVDHVNQIFTRDIAFVIDDYFIKANILPDRDDELPAIQYLIDKVDSHKIIQPPEEVHIEGGDVMLCDGHVLVGTYKGPDYKEIKTARTNIAGVNFIRDLFADKKVIEMDLLKSTMEARDNALHLDCCFQPVGTDKAIIYRDAFIDESDYNYLVKLYGKENLFHITRDEMYHMYSNIFSIAPDVVVSEKNFTRLNNWLRKCGLTVEEIPYSEIAKQGGLLRCSTLPLIRD